jgi:AcrR family transcriptional regulator
VSAARDELLARCITWFAEHGVGDTSLRTLAATVGSSHRMLLYHFGSREGLLAAVVESVEQGERDLLQRLLHDVDDPYAAGLAFWDHVADAAGTFAPLYFELSGHAMQGQPWAAGLRTWLTSGWTEALTDLWIRLGRPADEAVRAGPRQPGRGARPAVRLRPDRRPCRGGRGYACPRRRPRPPRAGRRDSDLSTGRPTGLTRFRDLNGSRLNPRKLLSSVARKPGTICVRSKLDAADDRGRG